MIRISSFTLIKSQLANLSLFRFSFSPFKNNEEPPAICQYSAQNFQEHHYYKQYKEGFEMAYKSILQSVVENDEQFLRDNLEQNLYRKITQYTRESLEPFQIVNQNSQVDAKIAFMRYNVGIQIDRSQNLPLDQYHISERNQSIIQKFYYPRYLSPKELIQQHKNRPQVIQVGVRFKTDFRLKNEQPQLFEDFWMFETISGSMQESLWSLLKIRLRHGSQGVKKALEEKYFQQWIITDINNTLKGNPYAV